MSVLISAVIPTHNRADLMAMALQSLCEQSLPPERFEICVVDNAGSDNAAAIVQDVAARYPRHKIKYVYEAQIGVSYARNAGIEHTAAPLIAYADDDATAPFTWLEQILDLFDSLPANVAKIAGEIVPIWESPKPDWITEDMLRLISATSAKGPIAGYCEPPLLELNCCYRREALVKAGGFPANLGRRGVSLLSGEQVVDIKMYFQGSKFYHDPALTMFHRMHGKRLNPAWFRQRYFWQGVSKFLMDDYLANTGFIIDRNAKLTLPLDPQDWRFLIDPDYPVNDQNLEKLRSLGFVLAGTGILDVQAPDAD